LKLNCAYGKLQPKNSSTKTNLKNINKIELLNLIKRKKSILFGKFSNELDNREKHSAWEEVLSKAKSLGMVTEDRRAEFVRDKFRESGGQEPWCVFMNL